LSAPWTLALNQHVRIDIVSQRLRKRTRDWIDVIGHALFLLPVAAIVVATSLPFAATSLAQREGSSNFGGLPQWPLKMLIPVGFTWLFVQ
ncbi:TRAP transporter small permease subunit, partial [Acinetobacter baumannii]